MIKIRAKQVIKTEWWEYCPDCNWNVTGSINKYCCNCGRKLKRL